MLPCTSIKLTSLDKLHPELFMSLGKDLNAQKGIEQQETTNEIAKNSPKSNIKLQKSTKTKEEGRSEKKINLSGNS